MASQSILQPGVTIDDYFLLEQIGEGASGCIFTGLTIDNDRVVLKMIPLSNNWLKKEYRREVLALKNLESSPKQSECTNIIKLIDSFICGNYGVIVLQRMEMDLLSFIELGEISHDNVKLIYKQVCNGIKAMHSRNIAHLDIKPENIFLNTVNDVVVGDFGSSFQWSKVEPRKFGVCGTTFYCAPEVKKNSSYSPAEADIWSLGVLLHVLFTGYWPFAAKTQSKLLKKISRGEITLLSDKIPDDVEPLIVHMLSVSPNDRPTIYEVLAHPWLEDKNEIVLLPKRVKALRMGSFEGGNISSSSSIPDLAEIYHSEDSSEITNEVQGDTLVSTGEVKVREKKKRSAPPSSREQKRRSSWDSKPLLQRIAKFVR